MRLRAPLLIWVDRRVGSALDGFRISENVRSFSRSMSKRDLWTLEAILCRSQAFHDERWRKHDSGTDCLPQRSPTRGLSSWDEVLCVHGNEWERHATDELPAISGG
jgi:hypothetical protein